jgi:hypothetical protein
MLILGSVTSVIKNKNCILKEDAPEALGSSEKSFNLIASAIHRPVVFPWRKGALSGPTN